MNELNMTYEAIASNENLSDPLKEQFMGLTQVFHQTFENVNLDNYNERIKSLRIKRGSKLFIKTDSEYSPRENILYLNEDKLMETDACHSMMMRTLEMVTAKDNYYGINDNYDDYEFIVDENYDDYEIRIKAKLPSSLGITNNNIIVDDNLNVDADKNMLLSLLYSYYIMLRDTLNDGKIPYTLKYSNEKPTIIANSNTIKIIKG